MRAVLLSLLLVLHPCAALALTRENVTIFTANDTLKSCYRNPVLVTLSSGDLLCFIEERFRGASWTPNERGDHSCSDNGGGHNLGFSRSVDQGRTWSPIIRLAGNITNLKQGGVDFTNNAAVVMKLPNGSERILWQGGTQNNPSKVEHGRIFQRTSDDGGLTWSKPTDITYAAASVGFAGGTPGPGTGIQLPDGKIAFCAWGNNASVPFKKPGWGLAVNFANFITWSDDYGKTWHATEPVGARGWNECFIAVLPRNHSSGYSVLEIARRVRPDSSVPPPYAYPPHTYAAVRFSADFQTRSPIVTLDPHVETPVCEGSLLVHGNDVYFSHPQSTSSRTNLTIHKSEDGGSGFGYSLSNCRDAVLNTTHSPSHSLNHPPTH